ncbi:hypothetical protein M409DRAFT_16148 [Zasmidium cellare ATCC 36951]|uniref:Uncharacterized protein n=1 Tax=Zasmidium cellare ATCC 36951 TaxID=1080233 RepID=A0A6A6D6T5_ZASCE|nr:uncharacterized protein M409DRAFT_16148 [Zasmidium cellare ATCC 36951]KAF2173879.1 hypothetical protein M409DRAFT_16148 [Zasmidium cellare ATCC 36951]
MKNCSDIPRCGMPPLDRDTMRALWRRPDPTLQQIAQGLNIDWDHLKEIRQFIMGELLKPSDVEATIEDVLENAIEIQEGDVLLMYQLRNTNEHGKTYWRDIITTMKIQSEGFEYMLFPDTFDTPQAP